MKKKKFNGVFIYKSIALAYTILFLFIVFMQYQAIIQTKFFITYLLLDCHLQYNSNKMHKVILKKDNKFYIAKPIVSNQLSQ